ASSPPRPRPVPSRPRAAMYARTTLLRAVYVAVVLFLRPPLPATGAAKIIRIVAALGGARGRARDFPLAHAACLGLRGNILSLVHATSPVGSGEARAAVQPHSCPWRRSARSMHSRGPNLAQRHEQSQVIGKPRRRAARDTDALDVPHARLHVGRGKRIIDALRRPVRLERVAGILRT